MLILIKGNDFLAQNNVTRILPVRLKVKLKTISGHRMPNDGQFTSMITITVTYPRKGVRCAVETRLLPFLLYIVCSIVVVVVNQSNAIMCTHIRGVRKRYLLTFADGR